ncbi:type IV pilus modification protein PilV [Salinisphaera aquimarina]|uniref:Type IV pilus modification protein PilV n=1 Tax=Salinisphaera aquimarina TaxID=2094031 RepID=A0ABV7ESF2_9GAMM
MKRVAQPTIAARGFTLLEALVALVVISIGLLGLLGLQTVSVVNTQTSESRSLASIAADDIADRIRANPDGAADGEYDAIAHPAKDGAAMPSPDCAKTLCTAQQMAALDAWEWDRAIGGDSNDIKGYLPNGRGYVDCTTPPVASGDPCRAYTVTIGWDERAAPSAGGQPTSAPAAGLAACDSDLHTNIGNQCFITTIRP